MSLLYASTVIRESSAATDNQPCHQPRPPKTTQHQHNAQIPYCNTCHDGYMEPPVPAQKYQRSHQAQSTHRHARAPRAHPSTPSNRGRTVVRDRRPPPERGRTNTRRKNMIQSTEMYSCMRGITFILELKGCQEATGQRVAPTGNGALW